MKGRIALHDKFCCKRKLDEVEIIENVACELHNEIYVRYIIKFDLLN